MQDEEIEEEEERKFPKKEKKTIIPSPILWKQEIIDCYFLCNKWMAALASCPRYERGKRRQTEEYMEYWFFFQSSVIRLYGLLGLKMSVLSKEERLHFVCLDNYIVSPILSYGETQPIDLKKLYKCFQLLRKTIELIGVTKLERDKPDKDEVMA